MAKMTNEEASEPTQLAILPLPGGGTVTPETALVWLREDFPHFHTVVCNVAAEGPNQEVRNSASFLGLDLGIAHDACTLAIEAGTPQSFERDDTPAEWDSNTLNLAHVCAGRHVMNHSTGPFEWAFDELAEELARRLENRCGREETAHA